MKGLQVVRGDPFLERHYTITELAEMWSLDKKTVRMWFADEPGVLKHGHGGLRANKRTYVTLRVPESVARRVYQQRARSWAEEQMAKRKPAASSSTRS